MKLSLKNKGSGRWRRVGANLLLLLLGIFMGFGVLELALRIGDFDQRMGPRSYDVNGYEFRYHVTLNSDFFRDEEFHKKKGPGVFRIFLIGDSFVFGSGAGENETIDKLLEGRLNTNSKIHYEVFSLGHPGDTPFEYEQTARRYRDYEPDLVILSFYVDNDVWKKDWEKYIRVFGFWNELKKHWQTFLYQRGFTDCLFPWISKVKLNPFYHEKFCSGEINPYLALAEQRPELHRSYEEYRNLFKNHPDTKEKILGIRNVYPTAPFWLLLQPSKYQVSNSFFDTLKGIGFKIDPNEPVDRRLQDEIIAWAHSQTIDTLDLLPAMHPEDGARLYHHIDDHYNGAGNAFVAEQIERKLSASRLISENGKKTP